MRAKALYSLFLFCFCLQFVFARSASAYDLKTYVGKQSPLLFFAPSKSDPRFQKQLEAIKSKSAEIKRAKIVLFYIFENELGRADNLLLRVSDAQELRKNLKVSEGEFKILLLDLKGNQKASKAEALDAEALTHFLNLPKLSK